MINREDDYSYVVENGNGIFFDDGGFDEFSDFLEESNSKSAGFNYPNVDIPHLDYLTTHDLPPEASTSFLKKVKNNSVQGQPNLEDPDHFEDVGIASKRNPLAEPNGAEESQPSPELSNGVDGNAWTFEEDFIIMMCGSFYKDPKIAGRAIDRSESDIEDRYAMLQDAEKFAFDEKLYMLPRSQYLHYLRKVPVDEDDLLMIKSLSSAHVPTTKEISKLQKSLRLPIDTKTILWFWREFKHEHLLIDQAFERLNLQRKLEYVLDDVEKKADSDFLRNHRYLYNAIPGETSFMKTFQKNPLLELSLTDAVCSIIFEDSGKILPLKMKRSLLSFSESVELIPLIKKYNIFYPLKPYSAAVLIFWRNTDLFLVNLCLHSIMVGFNLVKPRYYIKLDTDRYTAVDINPTLTDASSYFYVAPNCYYFSTGRDVRLVPLPGKMKFSFGSEWPSKISRTSGEQVSTDLHIRAYGDAIKFMRRDKLPQITEDDFGYLNEVKSRQFKAREHVRDHPESGEKLITAGFQNKKIQDTSSSQEGHDSQIPKAKIDEKLLRSHLQVVNADTLEKPVNSFTTKDIGKLCLNIGLKQYEILQPTGCDVADVLYSSIFARYKQKSTLKKSVKKLDLDCNPQVPALPAKVMSKPSIQKQVRKVPLKRKIEPVKPVQVDTQMPNLNDSYYGDTDPHPPPARRRQVEIASSSGGAVPVQRSFYYAASPHTRVVPLQNTGTTIVGSRPVQKIRFTNRSIYTVTPTITTVPRQPGAVTYVQSPVHPVTYQIVPRMQSYRPRPPSAQNSTISSAPQSQVVENQGRVVDQTVHTVFANVADKYDLMNDAMSMGIHRLWKDYYVKRINPQAHFKVIDVAGGTGDIAFRMLRTMQRDPKSVGDITVFDINQNMLDVGQDRAQSDSSLLLSKLSWVCGNAEQLPFEDNTFDLYTIAFGIRNCTNVDKVLSEAFRVLKPTGRFTCLEFSQVNRALKPIYDLYSFQVIPVMGQLLASDYNSYKYLVESIRMFPDQQSFAEMIKTAGFTDVCYENLSLGICAIHTGMKK